MGRNSRLATLEVKTVWLGLARDYRFYRIDLRVKLLPHCGLGKALFTSAIVHRR